MASTAASINSSSHPEVKACAEALQSAQKRTRFAFFLVLAASCIVLLMVLNLWQSRQLLNDLIKDTADKSEYMKAYSKHIADNSFYQLPALGIQITCDDVGILGPLALLVFSFFTVIAFKALNSQVKSAAKQPFEGSPLIRALLETEQPLEKPLYLILRILSFLPLAACLFVIAYGIVWHFFNPPNIDSLPALSKNIFMAKIMDAFGGFFTLLVLFCNRKTFQLSQETKTKARECIRRHAEV